MTISSHVAMSDPLADLLADMRRVAAETTDARTIIKKLTPPLRSAALDRSWVRPEHYLCEGKRGNGAVLLHEEADHSLAVYVVAWQPGRGVLPHDHQTWGLIAGVDGIETNLFWLREDDGSDVTRCVIKESHRRDVGPGEVMAFLPNDIHSVQNDSDRIALSLHIYGRNLNKTGRSEFDPVTGRVSPLTL